MIGPRGAGRGVAVKAGDRKSPLHAWFVNDQPTATLIKEFYSELYARPQSRKPRQLQSAQVRLLADRRIDTPCNGKPYMNHREIGSNREYPSTDQTAHDPDEAPIRHNVAL